VLAIEAVAGAEILQRWIDLPLWLMALALMTLLTGVNLASVKSFGEFEFWFAGIKVVAIVAFIVIAVGYLFGIGGGESPGLSNLTSHDGFAPEGIVTILSGVVIVIFAFVGAEIVTIAAAESAEPEENVTRAVNQVVLRILTFYVAAIFLIVCILPWNETKPGESPFIAALEKIGIPGAADVMNAIIVTAVLSCLNSGMYTGSRMLFALARRGDAPQGLLDVNRRGVPVKAILLTSSIGFASTVISYLSPDTVFLFLVNSSGAIALFVYLLIAVSQLRMRRRLERESPDRLKVKMWLFPCLTYFAIVAMVVVIGSMALVEDVRSQLIPSFISLAVVLAAYWFKTRAERRTASVPAGAASQS
jgi:GABA permease